MLRAALIAMALACCGVASADPLYIQTPHFSAPPGTNPNARDPDAVDQSMVFVAGSFQTYRLPRTYKTVYIGSPDVLDVTAQSDRDVILRGLKPGISGVLFLDEDNGTVSKIQVIVNDGGPSRIKVHDKTLLTGYTAYRCWERGCEYVDEVISKEAVPTTTSTSTQTVIYRDR